MAETKKVAHRVGDLVVVKALREVAGRVISTRRAVSPTDANIEVELETGEKLNFVASDINDAEIVTAVATLDRAAPVRVKIEGKLTGNKNDGIHVHSRVFVGKPGGTGANAGELTMRREEWLAFTATLKLGARFSDGKLVVEVPHEPMRTDAGEPAHGCEMCDGDDYCTCPGKGYHPRCLTCGGSWPDCGK